MAQILPGDLTVVSTLPQFAPGTRYEDPSTGKVYRYVKGGGTIAQYEYCFITADGNFTATQLSATNAATGIIVLVGCAQQSAGLTSTTYGWVLAKGAHTGKVLASCVQDVKLFASATAGAIDDATASSASVVGVKLLTTVVGAAASAMFANVEMYTA